MNLANKILEERETIKATCKKYGATDIRVFGSYARHESDESSDLDILINLKTDKRGLAYIGLLADLEDELQALLGKKVDLVVESELRPRIRERVLQEAVSL